MEKILEQPLAKPLSLVRAKIEKRVRLLLKTNYLNQRNEYSILYSWNKNNNTLTLESEKYPVKGKIRFNNKRITAYLETIFWLRPLFWIHRDSAIIKIQDEIDDFIKTL